MKIAFYKGTSTIYEKIISWKTESPYTHCVAILDEISDGYCRVGASDPSMNGVYIYIDRFPADLWDIIDVPSIDIEKSREWFKQHSGQGYAYRSIINLVLPVGASDDRWFCDEAILASMGMNQPWRYDPAGLVSILLYIGGVWVQKQ